MTAAEPSMAPHARRPRRACVLLNANAGSKAGIPTNRTPRDEVERLLAESGLDVDLVLTDSAGEARSRAAAAVRDGVDLVVAGGGDGTIETIASELIGSETALGILPLGSVMNVPRMLGIPRDLAAAVDVLAHGVERRIDVGRADGRTFYEAGSVGMNAAIFREAQRFDRGDWLSIVRTIWVALRYRPARMEIDLDDRVIRRRALMVAVANGPYTGVAMTIAPDARLDDGQFDVRIFRGFSKWELVRHLASIAFGRRRYSPHISTYRARHVRVDAVHPLPSRADSRDLGTTPVEFEVVPGALRVLVPVDSPLGQAAEASVQDARL